MYVYIQIFYIYMYLCILCCVSCLPRPQTPIHKGGGLRPPSQRGGAFGPPPLWIPLWMGVWGLGRQLTQQRMHKYISKDITCLYIYIYIYQGCTVPFRCVPCQENNRAERTVLFRARKTTVPRKPSRSVPGTNTVSRNSFRSVPGKKRAKQIIPFCAKQRGTKQQTTPLHV